MLLGSTRRAPFRARLAVATSQSRHASTSSDGPTVGVVGAGIAGIQTIRAFQAQGFKVTAFEQAPKVGGLWRENYLNMGPQVPKQLFEFQDYPSPKKWGEFEQRAETHKYIEDYVSHYGLESAIELSTTVEGVVPDGEGWAFTTRAEGQESKTETFDYCIVATGMYCNESTAMAKAPGQEGFAGTVLHSSQFRTEDQAKGKKVVVIGGGKSAKDAAANAVKAGAEKVILASRRPHWPTPLKIADLIPFQYIFLSRFGQALVIGHKGPLPGCSPGIMGLWHKISWPIMAAAFKIVEVLFAAQFRNMSGTNSPLGKCDVVEDFYGFAHVLNYEFRDLVRSGKVEWRGEAALDAYSPDGVTLGGAQEKADVVVHATGFKKDYSIFSEETRKALNVEADGLYLYRHTVPTKVPRLGFVGSELAVISNISGYGLQAAWLARLWAGKLKATPASSEMEEEVESVKAWKRKWMPDTPSRASLVLLHQTHFHDRLLKDMGETHRRKGANVVAELLMPYEPADYNGVIG